MIGGGDFDQQGLRLDSSDIFGGAADFEAKLAERENLAVVEDNIGAVQVLHALGFHFDGIGAGLQGLEDENSLGVG